MYSNHHSSLAAELKIQTSFLNKEHIIADWLLSNNHYNMPYNNIETTSLYSDASSLDVIRTPDIGMIPFNNEVMYFPSNSSPSTTLNYQQDHHLMMLQNSNNNFDDNHQYFTPTNNSGSLTQLSKEQLIDRVVQLEMEKSTRTNSSSASSPLLFNHYYDTPVEDNTFTRQPLYPCKQKEKNEQIKMLACLWVNCSASRPTLDQLMTHICESHIGSGKATYFCEWQDCARNKKPFMKRHKMHNHMRTHTGERPFVCTVIGCTKTFSRPDSLSTHIKTHSDIRPYLCSMPGCKKAYFHSRSLRKHIKSSHMKNYHNHTSTIPRSRTTAAAIHHHHRNDSVINTSLPTATTTMTATMPVILHRHL